MSDLTTESRAGNSYTSIGMDMSTMITFFVCFCKLKTLDGNVNAESWWSFRGSETEHTHKGNVNNLIVTGLLRKWSMNGAKFYASWQFLVTFWKNEESSLMYVRVLWMAFFGLYNFLSMKNC